MTDMDKMMTEKVARAIRDGLAKWDKEDGSPPLTWEAMRAQAPNMAEMYLVMARAAISAYNPDDRLREALDNERGAKQLYKDFENTTDEHVELVFSANACPEHKALADEMREWFRAAVDAALSPLPQGDG